MPFLLVQAQSSREPVGVHAAWNSADWKRGRPGAFEAPNPLPVEGRLKGGLQHACDRSRIASLYPECPKCVWEGITLVGTVEDLPIAQIAASA